MNESKMQRKLRYHTFWTCVLMLILLLMLQLSAPRPIDAAPAGFLRKAAGELVETLLKKGGSKGKQELARLGGEKAVQKIVEQAWKHGGDNAVRRVMHYTSNHGATALRAMQHNPGRILQALDQLPANQIRRALGAINHSPATMTQLITQHGTPALQAVMRHPGVGVDIAQRLGTSGVQAALRLNTPQAIQLHRLTPQLAKVPSTQRDQILEMIIKAPARVLTFLEKHPRLLLTTAGVSVIIAYREAIMGSDNLILDAEGIPQIISKPGILERTLTGVLQAPAVEKSLLILTVLVGLAICIRILTTTLIRFLTYRRQHPNGHQKQPTDKPAETPPQLQSTSLYTAHGPHLTL